MPAPAISVLLPVYNGETTVDVALKSVLAQTYRDFEVVAVDDGSTDGTAQILARHADTDARVRVISTPNRGLVAALNTAIEASRGALGARMDADDICEPTRFVRQVAHLEAHADCVVVGSEVTLIDTAGAAHRRQPRVARSYRLKDRCRNFTKFPPSPPTVPHPSAMIRMDALRQVGGYREYFAKGAEDRDLWWRLMPQGEVHKLPGRLLRYRVHPSNRSATLRAGAVADALVSDFSAIARHFGLDDLAILKDYRADQFAPTAKRYAALIGDRYPVEVLAQYRVITRKLPEMLDWKSAQDMHRDASRHVLTRPVSLASWRVALAALKSR